MRRLFIRNSRSFSTSLLKSSHVPPQFKKLQEDGVRFLRVLWTDTSNHRRCKVVPLHTVPEYFLRSGVGVDQLCYALPATADIRVDKPGLNETGEARLIPDLDTLRKLPYDPLSASITGDFLTPQLKNWDHCVRTFLKQQLYKAETEYGLKFNLGFENEFSLVNYNEKDEASPVEQTVYCSSAGLVIAHKFIYDLIENLEKQNININCFHTEAGYGQFEVSLMPEEALKAVDNELFFRETLTGVAHKHKVGACLLPAVFETAAGNGLHVHIGIEKNGVNIFSSGSKPAKKEGDKNIGAVKGEPVDVTKDYSVKNLSSDAHHFMAGILHHAPGLLALTCASPNSYRRIKPSSWATPYVSWGFENREAMIRIPIDPTVGINRLEFRLLDHTANAYIAIGSIIACGLDGIKNKYQLQPEAKMDPAEMTEKQIIENKIKHLPANLPNAINELENNELLGDALGKNFLKTYLAVKRFEVKTLSGASLKDEVAKVGQRY